MTWTTINEIARYGIVPDLSPHTLPPGAWSSGSNVRFRDRRIIKGRGFQGKYSQTTRQVYWGTNFVSDIKSYWVYADLTDLYIVVDNVAESNITRHNSSDVDEQYSTGLDQLWNGGNLNGVLILNNGSDTPQQFVPGVDTRASNLTNWPTDLLCNVIRPFGYYLVAMNLKQGTEARVPNRIRWSHPAVPGEVPSSWDITDAAVDAGEFDLPDRRPGDIVDGAQLRDWFLIYERNAIWGMRFVGGNNIFSFTQLFPTIGALATDCVAPFDHRGGQFHCVYTGDNIIAHDGRSVIQTLEGRATRQVMRELDESNWRRSYVVNIPEVSENWICYPSLGSLYPNRALTWNFNEDTVSFRDLDNINWITLGIVDDGGDRGSWDEQEGTWGEQSVSWGSSSEQQHNIRPVGFSRSSVSSDASIVQMDESTANDGEIAAELLERRDLAILPDLRTRDPIADLESRKMLKGVRLQLTGGPIEVSVAATEKVGQIPAYGNQYTLTEENSELFDIVEGRSFCLRISAATKNHWELSGYSLDIERTGDS